MGMTESDYMNQWGIAQEEACQITRQEWMDKMDEVEVLSYLISLLYHYDVATEYVAPENFDTGKWGVVRETALAFFNEC